MGKWIYRKPEPVDVKGICVVCQKAPQMRKYNGKYAALCHNCDRKRFENPEARIRRLKDVHRRKRPHLIFRGDRCELCGFIPKHECQLDVDHKDGNHYNNDPNNLQTLCANCHRLKTWKERQA